MRGLLLGAAPLPQCLWSLHPQKRLKAARTFYDRVADQVYLQPLTSQPQLFMHTKDLVMGTGSSNDYGFTISDLRWR